MYSFSVRLHCENIKRLNAVCAQSIMTRFTRYHFNVKHWLTEEYIMHCSVSHIYILLHFNIIKPRNEIVFILIFDIYIKGIFFFFF